jgi:hypothetical protein
MSGIGATSFGRWHCEQFLKKMGATSVVKVGAWRASGGASENEAADEHDERRTKSHAASPRPGV